ncbi:hypothetical protein OS493_035453 [Desmophyllum pertusum]|uniref:Uncharacterized protein n=1 Tax=Desmophyllum pertusum TaxID=174260 RepID=A0A9W9Z957_9CNID|nr:hypothetical protein OS493_035453 [Desmophyllum pertusum]
MLKLIGKNKQHELQARIEELDGASEREMKEAEVAFSELKDRMLELEAEKDDYEQKAGEETVINRRLGTEVDSLEAQLAHADQTNPRIKARFCRKQESNGNAQNENN